MRPTTVKELAATVSDFASSGNISLPRAFAVEFSPALLIGGKTLTLSRYQSKPALYRFRLSVATRRPEDSASPTQVAAGVRVSLIDEADLRMNSDYLQEATDIARQVTDVYVAARRRTGPPPTPIELTSVEEDSITKLQTPLVQLWENKKWNSRVLDLAAGIVAQGQDSLGRDLRSNQLAAWGTFGTGLRAWGELLLGAKIASHATCDRGLQRRGQPGRPLLRSAPSATSSSPSWAARGGAGTTNGCSTAAARRGSSEAGVVSFSAGLVSTSDRTDLRTNLAVKLGAFGI